MPSRIDADELYRMSKIDVFMDGRRVGTLAQPSPRAPVYFEYDATWLASGFSISPFSLPLEAGVHEPPTRQRAAIHGVFADSLPDDWGRLLVDRMLAREGAEPARVGLLARLALVGRSGRGALEYRPSVESAGSLDGADFDRMFRQSLALVDRTAVGDFDELYRRGGSSGGARPKVMTEIDGFPWLVKFPLSQDDSGECAEEYRLACIAKSCGIDMPETRLIPSSLCEGFFAVRRFDRGVDGSGAVFKVHMASACALLEADPFEESADYRDLMRLSLALTSDVRDSEQLFRVLCFNVFVGNCDDHIRNFSFLCDRNGTWHLSPAYDLTRNTGFFGEHSVLVNGKGAGITRQDLCAVAKMGNISGKRANGIIDEIHGIVLDELGEIDPAFVG